MTRKRVWNRFESYFTLQSLHKVLPSFTSYHKRCRNYFLVLLCTTSLARTSQYYLVLQKQLPILNGLQGLRKVLPSTTLYCKACTKHFPLLLCTAKSAQSISQSETNLNRIWNESETNLKRIFVLESLLKDAQSTSKHFLLQALNKVPSSVTLSTTSIEQSTSQYYFALQASHKVLPSSFSNYKRTSQHYFVLQSLHRALPNIPLC